MEITTTLQATVHRVNVTTDLFDVSIEMVKEGETVKSINANSIRRKEAENLPELFAGTCYKDSDFIIYTLSDRLTVEERKAFVADFDAVVQQMEAI